MLGGGGFIGANLVRRLVAKEHQVTAVDVAFPGWRPVDSDRWTLDLRNPSQAACAVAGVDWVFHLAADMGGVGYFHGPADFGAATTNGLITANVLRACVAERVPRVFLASSACAYPIELQDRPGRPVKLPESYVGHGTPDALYGAEKLQALRLAAKVPGARVGILHTVYGPLQEHEGRRMKFPAAVATKALAARHTGELELWGDGRQMRSYLHVDDAVERIVRVMGADNYEGPVNIGAEGAVTCREVAELCCDVLGIEARITTNEAEPSGVLARDCDNREFDRRYGKGPDMGLRAGFTSMLGWLEEVMT